MAWAIWLAIPVVATLLAALFAWVRDRPRRAPGTRRTMQQHAEYLDALVIPARESRRPDR